MEQKESALAEVGRLQAQAGSGALALAELKVREERATAALAKLQNQVKHLTAAGLHLKRSRADMLQQAERDQALIKGLQEEVRHYSTSYRPIILSPHIAPPYPMFGMPTMHCVCGAES